MRRHGNDGYVGALRLLLSANGGRRRQPVEDRHLNVHEHEIERCVGEGRQDCLAVANDHHHMALLLQGVEGHPLIDAVILGQQDVQGTVGTRLCKRGDGGQRCRRVRGATQGCQDGIPEFRLGDGLHQVPSDAHLPTASGIARQICRGQHQNRRPRQGRILLHVRGDGKAIHLGHVRVEQHERERLALRPGLCEPGECLPPAVDHGGPHLPATEHLLENASVGGIIRHSASLTYH